MPPKCVRAYAIRCSLADQSIFDGPTDPPADIAHGVPNPEEWPLSRVESLLIKWQERLALSDWTIRVVFSRVFDLRDYDIAEVTLFLSKHQASIEIRDPKDWPPSWANAAEGEDIEVALVHELVHVRFLHQGSLYDELPEFTRQLIEVGVHRTALALVRLANGH